MFGLSRHGRLLLRMVRRKQASEQISRDGARRIAIVDVVKARHDPCLLAVVRLSMHAPPLDPGLPPEDIPGLLRALVRVGEADRAATVIRAIRDPELQGRKFIALVRTMAELGDREGAEAWARSISAPQVRARALIVSARAYAGTGDFDRATALAGSIAYPHLQARAWAELAKAAADLCDANSAVDFAHRAQVLSGELLSTEWKVEVLLPLMEAVASIGEGYWAGALADQIEDFVRYDPIASIQPCGNAYTPPNSKVHARPRYPAPDRQDVLTALLAAEVRMGQLDRLDALMRSSSFLLGPHTLAAVLYAVADTAPQDVVPALADWAGGLLQQSRDDEWHEDLLLSTTGLLTRHGHTDRAETLARSTSDPQLRQEALAAVAAGLASNGKFDRAEILACAIGDPELRAESQARVVKALGRHGQVSRGETLARSIDDPHWQAQGLAALARLVDECHARTLVGRALLLDGWVNILEALAQVQPAAVIIIADGVLSR